jgi:hypothetical protein
MGPKQTQITFVRQHLVCTLNTKFNLNPFSTKGDETDWRPTWPPPPPSACAHARTLCTERTQTDKGSSWYNVHWAIYSCSELATSIAHNLTSEAANWTITMTEEHRMRKFEKKVLRSVFWSKWKEVTGDWRKIHNEELHNLYSTPNILRVNKSRRARRAARMEEMTKANSI